MKTAKIRTLKPPKNRSTLDARAVRSAIKSVMAERTYDVVADTKAGGWAIKRPGAKASLHQFQTKKEAVSRARELCRESSAELVIYLRDGRIQESRRHGVLPKRG